MGSRKSTAGWELKVRTKLALDDSYDESWMPLRVLKYVKLIMTIEYAVSVGIDYQPAFSWWVHQTLKVRDKIVVAATRRMRQSKFKFGVEVPRDLDHAKKLDTDNGNTF